MQPQKYRKRPVEVEAVKLDGTNDITTSDWIRTNGGTCALGWTGGINIETLEGTMRADKGDYIVREPFATDDRKFYPVKADIFEASYDKVQD